MSSGHSVHLVSFGTNDYGATFWRLSVDTTCDGRGKGGLCLSVNVYTQREGLTIGGETISWEDLEKAKEYAHKDR